MKAEKTIKKMGAHERTRTEKHTPQRLTRHIDRGYAAAIRSEIHGLQRIGCPTIRNCIAVFWLGRVPCFETLAFRPELGLYYC